MKNQDHASLLAVCAAAFVLSLATSVAQPFASTTLKNRAITASPRALEVFPGLARNRVTPSVATQLPTAPVAVTSNRSLAASPRALEQFPGLGRPVTPLWKSTDNSSAAAVLDNPAIAASPRAVETFPWLARSGVSKTTEKTFSVAPLK